MEHLMGITAAFLIVTSGYFIVRTRGFHLRHPWLCLRAALRPRPGTSSGRAVSPLGGMLLALAGTLGVGNIAGVATALWLGGPGAVFWMIFSGLAVMVLKYAEILLAVRHRRVSAEGRVGGAPYYISDLLGRGRSSTSGVLSRLFAGLFAWLCILNALTMGSILQINAAASAMQGGLGLPPLFTGIAAGGLCAAVTLGGASRIARLTERLVPIMTAGFLILCAAVLILRHERLPGALRDIMKGAFSIESAGAGGLGFLLSRGMRVGVMRGLVSNEAGCGTAPMAHAAADTDSGAVQGILGMVEVFVDTVLLCSVTALTIMVSDTGYTAFGADGAACARSAFTSVLGEGAGYGFAVAVLLFALGSAFCWAHYGLTCVGYLCIRHPGKENSARVLFVCVFCLTLVLGSVTAPDVAWKLADAAIACMTMLNLAFLWVGRREIIEETDMFLHWLVTKP